VSQSRADQLERRNRELTILNEIAKALNQSVDLNDALQATLARMVDFFELHTGWIWLLHEETGEPYLAAAQHLPPALAENPRRMDGNCYCLDTFRAGDMSGAANVSIITCTRLQGLVDGTEGLRYHASIPLYAQEKRLGVLNVVGCDWEELAAEDLRLLYTVGDLLGMAIERIRLYSRASQIGVVEERNRLAREIHDTLAQGLAAVTLYLESADILLDTGLDAGQAHRAVQQALALTRASLDEARRSVLDLRAAPLEGRSLAQALAALAADLGASHGLRTRFSVTGGSRPLPVRVETSLFRVAQEALQNVIQHAGANEASIELLITPDGLELVIADDGCGFDPAQTPPQRFGLVGMNERVRLLGGEMQLHTEPGAGTRIAVTVPREQF
jgi:two-component system, NarL family, sensor kinase